MGNQKNKTNEQRNITQIVLLAKRMYSHLPWCGGTSEIGEEDKEEEASNCKIIWSQQWQYSIGNIVHNIVISLVTDDNYTSW